VIRLSSHDPARVGAPLLVRGSDAAL
jgi:hypothetical protein